MSLKVLVLAYHFPPSNSSAAHRPDSWAKYGFKYGLYPTIVTRHWKGLENEWLNFGDSCGEKISYEKNEAYEVIRLPYRNTFEKEKQFWLRNKYTRKIFFLFNTLSGKFHSQANVEGTYSSYLHHLLNERKFDVIIATAPPYQLLELASDLAKKFNIPFVADIRDLWNDNKALKESSTWTLKEKFNEFTSKYHIYKWLKKAKLITVVSKPMGKVFSENINIPWKEITNGYDADLYLNVEKLSFKEFTITLTGTIYPEQNFDVILKGFQKFLLSKPNTKINFIGISLFPSVEKKVKAFLPGEYINILPRISKREAIQLTVNSDVLFYVGWQGYKGFYSGKIFEYLAARNNILIAPNDHDVINDLLLKTKAGKSADTPEEVEAILANWYNEWSINGSVQYFGLEEEIIKYSREEQTRKFAENLQSIFPNKI